MGHLIVALWGTGQCRAGLASPRSIVNDGLGMGQEGQRICSNDAGVPHLGGWGCELGAVCCSPGAMMAVDETSSTGSCGVQDSVPFGVGDAVPAENPRARSC